MSKSNYVSEKPYHKDRTEKALRSVSRIVNSVKTLEGEGFVVHRSFPSRDLSEFDPFLLLDEMGPMELAPGEAKGAPDQPIKALKLLLTLLPVGLSTRTHKDILASLVQVMFNG